MHLFFTDENSRILEVSTYHENALSKNKVLDEKKFLGNGMRFNVSTPIYHRDNKMKFREKTVLTCNGCFHLGMFQ